VATGEEEDELVKLLLGRALQTWTTSPTTRRQ